jgi:hypothetical protein
LVCAYWDFQVSGFFRSKLGYMNKKENQGTSHCAIPQIPTSLASLLSVYIPFSLCFFFKHNVHDIGLYLIGRKAGWDIYSIFSEAEVST